MFITINLFIKRFAVLDILKWKMYDFHYQYMKSKFGESVLLNFMYTDSFIYGTLLKPMIFTLIYVKILEFNLILQIIIRTCKTNANLTVFTKNV